MDEHSRTVVPYRSTDQVTVYHGDCLEVLKALQSDSVHVVCTDPPYGLADLTGPKITETLGRWIGGEHDYLPEGRGFMGRRWDRFVPPPALWEECLRVLKPGGLLACFSGSRTVDLMGMSIRLAGFEIRDSLAWIFSQGFPKSGDTGAAIAKRAAAGADVPEHLASDFAGYASALKPALEPILIARKPFRGTLVDNVIAHGTGAYNIDGCRIGEFSGADKGRWPPNVLFSHTPDCQPAGVGSARTNSHRSVPRGPDGVSTTWHRGQDALVERHGHETVEAWDCAPGCQVAALDEQSGVLTSGANPSRRNSDKFGAAYGDFAGAREMTPARGADTGGASRFYYCAKATKAERPEAVSPDGHIIRHNTVKPLGAMRWLLRLIAPPGAVVLDPFAGSGTTLEAAMLEGFTSIGIEAEADFLPLIDARLGLDVDPAA